MPVPVSSAQGPEELITWCLNKSNAYSPDLVIKGCTAWIETGKAPAAAYVQRGNAYTRNKDYDRAIADFNQAMQLDPKFALAYSDRGLTYAIKRDYNRAIADASRAIELDPKLALAYVNRGNSYTANKNYDAAIADYTRALQLMDKEVHSYVYAIALYGRGVAKVQMGNRGGISDIEAAKGIKSDVAEVSTQFGLPVYGTYNPTGNASP